MRPECDSCGWRVGLESYEHPDHGIINVCSICISQAKRGNTLAIYRAIYDSQTSTSETSIPKRRARDEESMVRKMFFIDPLPPDPEGK